MSDFWQGAFTPIRKFASCDHGTVAIWLEEPEYGILRVNVQFDHTCTGGTKPPSNDTVYSFDYQLESYGSEADEEAADLQEEINNMSDSEKLTWINENLVHTE